MCPGNAWMIRYALICAREHLFEAWFASSQAYDEQVRAGLVACPVCGSTRVRKQLMRPAVATTRTRAAERKGAPAKDDAAPAIMDEQMRTLRDLARRIHEHVRTHAEYVGPAFAQEARKRARQKDARPVWGEASTEDVKELLDSGIEVLPLPPLPDKKN